MIYQHRHMFYLLTFQSFYPEFCKLGTVNSSCFFSWNSNDLSVNLIYTMNFYLWQYKEWY